MAHIKPFVFINSHPIQYFAPLYQYLSRKGHQTTCWYCSSETISGYHDRQFAANVSWDIPLLAGYDFHFFKNYSLRPSLYHGFFGLFNPGVIKALFAQPKSVIIVHGWAYFTYVLVILFGKMAGHIVCLRGENPINQEAAKGKLVHLAKRILLGKILFKWVDVFLYIGTQNKKFYQHFGVADSKLMFAPYAVDSERFLRAKLDFQQNAIALKSKYLKREGQKIVLFCAKYIEKKRPLDLLAAFKGMSTADLVLIMVGEGELRVEMERYVEENRLENVVLTGFINQTEISLYYAIADLFVLCSGQGETWGLSVNEALCYNMPIMVSSISGCADDLVIDGVNGHKFEVGNVADLSAKMAMALNLKNVDNSCLVQKFSFETISKTLSKLIE